MLFLFIRVAVLETLLAYAPVPAHRQHACLAAVPFAKRLHVALMSCSLSSLENVPFGMYSPYPGINHPVQLIYG